MGARGVWAWCLLGSQGGIRGHFRPHPAIGTSDSHLENAHEHAQTPRKASGGIRILDPLGGLRKPWGDLGVVLEGLGVVLRNLEMVLKGLGAILGVLGGSWSRVGSLGGFVGIF